MEQIIGSLVPQSVEESVELIKGGARFRALR